MIVIFEKRKCDYWCIVVEQLTYYIKLHCWESRSLCLKNGAVQFCSSSFYFSLPFWHFFLGLFIFVDFHLSFVEFCCEFFRKKIFLSVVRCLTLCCKEKLIRWSKNLIYFLKSTANWGFNPELSWMYTYRPWGLF